MYISLSDEVDRLTIYKTFLLHTGLDDTYPVAYRHMHTSEY
jgi:hypothetical protein